VQVGAVGKGSNFHEQSSSSSSLASKVVVQLGAEGNAFELQLKGI